MKQHLLQIDNLHWGGPDRVVPSLNISIYKSELVSICSSSSLCVDFLKDAYKNHQISGVLKFENQKAISLSRGTPLKYIHSISRHAHLVESLSITDNIFSLRKCTFPHILYNAKHAKIAAADLMRELRLPIDINTPVSQLSLAEHHLLLLAKAFVRSARLIILDNIVEYYTLAELRLFLDFIRRLQTQGFTFLAFTNGPSLLTQVSDRIFVTQNNEITNILYHSEYSDKQLASMMLGGNPNLSAEKESFMQNDIILSLNWSSILPGLPRIHLHRQECFCVFNVNGSNIEELYNTLTGAFPYTLDGTVCTDYSSAVKNGLAPISLSRLEDYLFPHLTLDENLILPVLHKISTAGVINKKLKNYCANASLEKMHSTNDVKTDVLIKTILLRWQLTNPKLMLLSDLNVADTNRPEVYTILNDINKSGAALMILSFNLYDCLYFADTLLVIKDSENFRLFYKSDPSFTLDVKSYLYDRSDI